MNPKPKFKIEIVCENPVPADPIIALRRFGEKSLHHQKFVGASETVFCQHGAPC